MVGKDAGLGEGTGIGGVGGTSIAGTLSRAGVGGVGIITMLSGDEGLEGPWSADPSMSVHSSDSLEWPGLELHVVKEFREETLLNLDHRPLDS